MPEHGIGSHFSNVALRRACFGCDLAPLPRSLTLTAADEALNRRAKLPIARGG